MSHLPLPLPPPPLCPTQTLSLLLQRPRRNPFQTQTLSSHFLLSMLLPTRPQRPRTLAACPLAHLGMTCLVGSFCRIFCFARIPQISSVTRCRDTEEQVQYYETSILAWQANLFLPCNVLKRFWAVNRSLNSRISLRNGEGEMPGVVSGRCSEHTVTCHVSHIHQSSGTLPNSKYLFPFTIRLCSQSLFSLLLTFLVMGHLIS